MLLIHFPRTRYAVIVFHPISPSQFLLISTNFYATYGMVQKSGYREEVNTASLLSLSMEFLGTEETHGKVLHKEEFAMKVFGTFLFYLHYFILGRVTLILECTTDLSQYIFARLHRSYCPRDIPYYACC